jgi:hypothetical protein
MELNLAFARQDYRPLDDIAQFADVPRPVMTIEAGQDLAAQVGLAAAVFLVEITD